MVCARNVLFHRLMMRLRGMYELHCSVGVRDLRLGFDLIRQRHVLSCNRLLFADLSRRIGDLQLLRLLLFWRWCLLRAQLFKCVDDL